MPTIREVSLRAQVSTATVSRVLNKTGSVNEMTRQRVLEAIDELGYRPNAFAQSLASNRSDAIGVIINEITSPSYAGIARGIEQIAEAHNMHLLVSSGHADLELERKAVEFLKRRRSDVLIVHLEATPDYDIIALSKETTPLVIVGRYIPELEDSCVCLDNIMGGYQATRYLIDQGHKRIAHITGWLAIHDSRDRLDGYKQALAESDIAFDESLVVEGNFNESSGQRAAVRLLERGLDFSAIFVANDQMAAGALQALREHGLSIPDDISLVGYDDVLLARYVYPSLTTIRQPLEAMVRAAAELALARLEPTPLAKPYKEVMRRFEPELIVRQSVRAL